MNKVYVLDTNVLLADPNVLLSYPRAEVVIPETVLGELDKLKTARVDPDLRFRGREVSRLLFELSEEGSLIEGVELPDGGTLRVAPFDSDAETPDGLATRNADDKILATAYQVCKATEGECEVTLVTNDLNMLLKAQTLGIDVSRHGDGTEGGFARRYIIRPFQRYRIPLTILAIAVAVFMGILAIAYYSNTLAPQGSGSVPREFRALLSSQQQEALDALITLQNDADNSDALLKMGDFYFDQVAAAQQSGDQAAVLQGSRNGIRYYQNYLRDQPQDNEARSDMAALLFYSGQTDPAIQEVGKVLARNPDHVNANYNLGIFYWQGRRDLQAARDQMQKVVRLTEDDSNQHGALQRAQITLDRIEAELNQSETSTGAVQ